MLLLGQCVDEVATETAGRANQQNPLRHAVTPPSVCAAIWPRIAAPPTASAEDQTQCDRHVPLS
jgi:hypothetical protein